MEGKNIRVEKLVDGEIYYEDMGNGNTYISLYKENEVHNNIYIQINRKTFNKTGEGVKLYNVQRVATELEKAWLNYCIEKDKYISYEDFLKEYKPTYEKGKWYKLKTIYDWYAKFEKFSDNCWYASEFIDVGDKSYKDSQGHWDWKNTYKSRLVTDLKEIESYLPKDHPDIQQKPETFVGRYFKALVENAECSNIIKNNYYLIEQEDDLYFRFYTEFSEDSLFCLDKSLSGIYELMPIGWTPSDVVPEYVQLVKKGWSVNGEYIGEIFDLSNLSNLSKFKYAPTKSEFLKNINKWIKEGCFKISDKKSYDLQNSKQYPLVPEECYNTEIEVGDEVEITINKYNHSPYKVGESFIIREISEQNGKIYYRPIEGICTGIISTSVKLVKKANKTTTLDKKVDVISSKVPERLQLKIRETVVENTIEERIKLKLNNLKTIKIKQHVN